MVIETSGPEETFALGERLGRRAQKGQIYTLEGALGAGKTVFAQGFAAGLGIGEPVNSPTFTVVQVYDSGRLPLYHFDAYRIEDEQEMDEIGYEDYFFGDGVCLIEWASLICGIIPEGAVAVRIERIPERGQDCRRITVTEQTEGVTIEDSGN